MHDPDEELPLHQPTPPTPPLDVIEIFGDTCSICLEEDTSAVLSCSNGHHICSDCVDNSVTAECGRITALTKTASIGFKCSCCEVTIGIRQIPASHLQSLMRALQQNAGSVAERAATQRAEQQQREQLAQQNSAEAVLERHATAVDAILKHRCPDCGQQWEDFTACCALTCGWCSAIFCAHCNQQFPSNNDCHGHVMRCTNNPRQRQLSMSMAVFNRARNARWMTQVRKYMDNNVPPALSAPLLAKFHDRFLDLGIDPTDF